MLSMSQVRWALAKTQDNITLSAGLLGCSRATLYNYIQAYPELQEFRREILAAVCDQARAVVYKSVGDNNVRTSVEVLKSQDPNWKPKQTVEHHGTVQHSLQGQEVMPAAQILAMAEADLKKMIAVRESERADARANVAGIEAAIAERATEAEVSGPGTGPETDPGESTSDL